MIVTGHRGARGEAPENTVDGFAHAAAIGLASVEFDVRMTADGRLVVIHDATVDRTTDGSGPVAELSAAALAELDAAGAGWPNRCPVPTLAEVLEATAGFEQLEVEIKADTAGRTDRVVEETLAALDRHGRTGAAVLTSFHLAILRRAHQLAPELRRGLIGDWSDPATVAQALEVEAARACLHLVTSSAEICRAARAAGLEVIGWPCADRSDWDRCRDWAVDGVTTDYPSRLLGYARGELAHERFC